MKRKIVLLLTLFMMLPIFANGEQAGTEETFHFPWGIEQTDTLYTAAEKAKIGTGWNFHNLFRRMVINYMDIVRRWKERR